MDVLLSRWYGFLPDFFPGPYPRHYHVHGQLQLIDGSTPIIQLVEDEQALHRHLQLVHHE